MGYEKAQKNSWTFWQTTPEDGVPEPAILIQCYGDIFSLECDGHSINVNYESIDEFCKLLKEIKKRIAAEANQKSK